MSALRRPAAGDGLGSIIVRRKAGNEKNGRPHLRGVCVMKTPRTLNVGAIGYGARGNILPHAHRPDEGVAVVAVADVSPAALERFKSNRK